MRTSLIPRSVAGRWLRLACAPGKPRIRERLIPGISLPQLGPGQMAWVGKCGATQASFVGQDFVSRVMGKNLSTF